MSPHEDHLRKERFARIRRVKRLLRPLPRKATIHRYPVLKLFAEKARKRAYLWSFRASEVVPALYAGWILTLLPLLGFQFVLGFLLAFGLRANLMVIIGLQLLSNIVTASFIYYITYHVGDFFLSAFINHHSSIDPSMAEAYLEGGSNWSAEKVLYLFKATSLGAIILGYFAAFISSFIYQFMAKRARRGYELLIDASHKLTDKIDHGAHDATKSPASNDEPTKQ